MNKRIVSAALSLAMALSAFGGFAINAYAEGAKTPQYQEKARQMEKLNRGLIAVYRTADGRNVQSDEAGVYLSWRLLGDESLENQAFDIYKNNSKIHTTGEHDATNWIDIAGTDSDTYKVVKAGADTAAVEAEAAVTPAANHVAASSQYTNLVNSFTYMDIPVERPADEKSLGGDWSYYYNLDRDHEGGANDASVGDLDGDEDYEIVLKWDPTNAKDASSSGYSGRVYIDAYEIDPNLNAENNANGHLYKWRIDLGQNIRAGAHDTQFFVYDFDGDGKAEVAMQTALGSKDGLGEFVTKAGDTEEIRSYTDEDNNTVHERKGHNIGPDFYTVFDGETGEALCTTAGIPLGREDGGDWGDSKMQRSHRFLGAVAYIDGVHPSIVMCRGYYNKAVVRAYTWDGSEMSMQWEHNGNTDTLDSLYGQGNHNLSVADVDNDGRDEIVYGSAVLDDDGTVIGNTRLNHGDAMHVSDFNNDGIQEVFSVKEKSAGYKNNAADFRVAATGKNIWGKGASGDTGRGVMANIDDEYAKTNPDALALGWSSSHTNVFDLKGNELQAKPATAGSGTFDNFLVYWDGDLSRELLDANIIQKYDAANGWSTRFWGESDGYTLTGGTTNNYSKRNPCLSADLWGDWREEIIMATGKGKDETPALRIFTSTIPTDYRLTTLMHDSQYRMAIAWQNVAYNQPPHQSYYIGSVALAADESGNELNYLAPAVPYTKVTYEAPEPVAVTGVEITDKEVTVEKGKTVSVKASVIPADATKKGITWTSSDTSVATVDNGSVKGVGAGTATITVTTRDGGFTDTCTVTVFENPVTSVTLSEKLVELGVGNTATIKANVFPEGASDKSVKWLSDDTSVATVSGSGVITGVGLGKTTVTATAGDKTAKCIVKVKPMNIVNATGENVFETTNTTDDTIKFTGAKDSAAFTLAQATQPIEFHKDFTPYSENTATLSFHFTTGGAKADGDYIWKNGHGYNTELKLLDTNGNPIFNIIEEHTTSGNATKYAVGGGDKQNASSWKKISGDADSPWNRSQIRWDVTVTFDYAADTGTINLAGCNNTWVRGETYETTFPLNGASFKTLKYETNNLTDWVSGSPKLEQLTYTSTEQVSGNTDVLYEKGTDNIEWEEADLSDWTQTGTETASLALDSENGRIWYNPTNPGGEYNAKKTVSGIADNGIVSYDVDWHFGLATGRTSVLEYIQFGSALRIGWTAGYVTWVSTDGGTTWNDNDSDGTADSIFNGENITYTKNVKVIFDKKANTIKSLTFDGKVIDAYTNYALPDGAAIDSVSFGLQRGGGTSNWNYPNGVDRIRVAQFIEGEEAPDFSAVKILTDEMELVDEHDVNVSYDLVDYAGTSAQLIGVLYGWDNEVLEIQTKTLDNIDASETPVSGAKDKLTFNKDIYDGLTLKVFMWDSLKGMMPVCYSDEYEIIHGTGALPSKTPVPVPTPELVVD